MIERHYGWRIRYRDHSTSNALLLSLGHIVAIGSNCGLFGLSHLGDYCASKFAVIGEMETVSCCSHDRSLVKATWNVWKMKSFARNAPE